ncbi:hypothetical protein EDD11_007968, partial [Mortierella claussenii]
VTCTVLQQNTENRSKYCHGCRAYFDRDIVGSENIARVCLSQTVNRLRPGKFKPTLS